MNPAVSRVRFTPAPRHQLPSGLLGFVSFLLEDCVRIDGVVLRTTSDGRLSLSFPARRDGRGRDHPYLRPVNDDTRRAIETQVFASLGLGEVEGR